MEGEEGQGRKGRKESYELMADRKGSKHTEKNRRKKEVKCDRVDGVARIPDFFRLQKGRE